MHRFDGVRVLTLKLFKGTNKKTDTPCQKHERELYKPIFVSKVI